jgi:acyl-CoA thioester hydrolase
MLRHTIRVRYAETDQMGVAHHGAFVPWLEEARIEGMRHLGLSYREMEERGVGMPVINLEISYRSKLVFDDVVQLETVAEIMGQSRVVFRTIIKKGEQVCAEAAVTVVTVNQDGRPIRIPDDVLSYLQKAGS